MTEGPVRFDDGKGVIRSRKSKDRQGKYEYGKMGNHKLYIKEGHGQHRAKGKGTINDRRNTMHRKLKIH